MLCSMNSSQVLCPLARNNMMEFGDALAEQLWKAGVKYSVVQQSLLMIEMKLVDIVPSEHAHCQGSQKISTSTTTGSEPEPEPESENSFTTTSEA